MTDDRLIEVTYGEVRLVAPQPPRQSRWDKGVRWLVFLRSLIVNLFVIVSICGVLVVTAKDLLRKPVIIERFSLPEAFLAQGYSGEVAAYRLLDAIQKIQTKSGTRKEQAQLLPAGRQLDVVEPGSGLSYQGLTQMLRSALGLKQTRITGEFVCNSAPCLPAETELRLRIFSGDTMRFLSAGPLGQRPLEEYFHDSALLVMEEVDPYILAAYWSKQEGMKERAGELALRLVTDDTEQSPWAAILLGNRAQERKDYQGSIEWFERSIALTEKHGLDGFAIPYHNWGISLGALGRHEEAIEKYRRATEIDPAFAFPWNNWGISLGALGRPEEAIEKYRRATEIDPAYAFPWNGWGNRLGALGRHEEAIEKYRRATEIDPESQIAWNNYANTLDQLLAETADTDCGRVADIVQDYIAAAGNEVPAWLEADLAAYATKCPPG